MTFHSPQIPREEVIQIAQYAIDNFRVCTDVIGPNIHSRIIKTLGLTRDSVVLNVGAGAYNQQSPDTLIQILPPTNLIVCDIDIKKLNTWKIFWDSEYSYEDGSTTPIVADARKLPFSDSCVDLVYSANFINDPNFTRQTNALEEFLAEAKRVLKSGGTVFLNSFGYLIGNIHDGEYCFNCDEHEIISMQNIQDLMQKIGFHEIKRQKPSRTIIRESLSNSTQVHEMNHDGCNSMRLVNSGGIIARVA